MKPIFTKAKIFSFVKQLLIFVALLALITSIVGYLRAPMLDFTITNEYFTPDTLKEITPADSNSSYILLFWGTWCPVCRQEAPFVNSLSKDIPIITVAVNSGSQEDIQTFMTNNGYTFKVVNDSSNNLAEMFAVHVFPTTFYIDKNRNIRYAEVGFTSHWGMKLRYWASQL